MGNQNILHIDNNKEKKIEEMKRNIIQMQILGKFSNVVFLRELLK